MTHKYAILSDLHLVQKNIPNYNNLLDFKALLMNLKQNRITCIFIAGDFFDEKKSSRSYLRHSDGETIMYEVRKTIREVGIPIYCLKGNHDAESVLLTTEQAFSSKLFHYPRNTWVELPDIDVYFLNSNADEFYDREEYNSYLLEEFKKIAKSTLKMNKTKPKILLMHENIASRPISISKDTLSILIDKFSLIFNGHEHVYQEKAKGIKNLINIPPALPSLLQIGKFWIKKFEHKDEGELKVTEREKISPFGYIELIKEDSQFLYDFKPFQPSIIPVNYFLKVQDLNKDEIMTLIKNDISNIQSQLEEKNIILPEISGEISFHKRNISDHFLIFQREFNNNYQNCYLDDLRTQNLKVISKIILIEPLIEIQLSVEDVGKKITQSLSNWVENVKEKNKNFSLSLDTCKTIFKQVFSQIENLIDDRGKKAEYLTQLLNKIRSLLPNHGYSEEISEHQIREIYYDVLGANN
ncbi:MAG: metallophosphoesterase family protein [Promethearchaeota archaeon]